ARTIYSLSTISRSYRRIMGSNSDERDSLEKRFGSSSTRFDWGEEDELIPNPPMINMERGRPAPSGFLLVPPGGTRGGSANRASAGRQSAEETWLSQHSENFKMEFPEHETISLLEELTSLHHVPPPATEQLAALLQALGQASMNITRNKHKVYSILRRSRDICDYISAAFDCPGDSDQSKPQPETMLEAMKQSYKLISALEEILLEVAKVLPVELETFGPATLLSWGQSQAAIIKLWDDLSKAPFDIIPGHEGEEDLLTNSSHFDDCAWFSRLLHEILEPEIARKFKDDKEPPPNVASLMEGLEILESGLKCRSIVSPDAIDMVTMLARTLLGTTSLRKEVVESRNNNTPTLGDENGNWLLDALAE
ncbi:hypothetical protein FS837_003352, partial [Tulasnella sp. UAMH 9824]